MSGMKPPKPSAPRGYSPELKERAMQLLAEGLLPAGVAKQLGIGRSTVREWRDSPDGQSLLKQAKKDRAAAFADAIADGHRSIRELIGVSVEVIREKLYSQVPFEALTAAREILDRGGMPRTERVENTDRDIRDMSKFTDAELIEWARLEAKSKPAKA